MSEILDRAKAHFTSLGRQQMDVAEWGVTVYWTPLTLHQKRKLISPDHPPDELLPARVVIEKAQDIGGKPMFSIDDYEDLIHRVDQVVLTRLATAMMSVPTPGEAEKN